MAAALCLSALGLLAHGATAPAAPSAAAGMLRADGRELALDEWLEQQMIPSLTEKLTSHPRYRGRSLQVVVMRGDSEPAFTHALALDIRQRLISALADAPGSRVLPQRSSDERADCVALDSLEYRVAVDVEPRGGGSARVHIRVFDLHENNWVGGIGGQWEGMLDGSQRRRLAESVALESARGQRELPFGDDETDLLAGALARELHCALRTARAGSADLGERRVYLEVAEQLTPELQKTALLVMHSLALEHGLRRVDSPEAADIVLRPHAHAVDPPLTLYWLTLERRRDPEGRADEAGDGVSQAGGGNVMAKARAYITSGALMASPSPADTVGSAPSASADRPPPDARVGPARRDAGDGALADARLSGPPRQALLSAPRLHRAADCEAVATASPMMEGGDAGSGRHALAVEAGCAGIEFEVTRPANVYLLWQPATCELAAVSHHEPAPARLERRRVREAAVIRSTLPPPLAAREDFASLYVIAVEAGADSAALDALLAEHPGGRDCGSPRWERALRRWALALESSLQLLGGQADWQVLRVPARTLRAAAL